MTQDEIMAMLEDLKWPQRVYSPYRPSSKVYKHTDRFTYVCKDSQRQFTVLTNTFLNFDRRSLEKWALFIDMLAKHTDELTIKSEMQVNDITLKIMYRKLFAALRLATPTMSRDLHFMLIRYLRNKHATTEYLWKALLRKAGKPKRKRVIKLPKKTYEAGLERAVANSPKIE